MELNFPLNLVKEVLEVCLKLRYNYVEIFLTNMRVAYMS